MRSLKVKQKQIMYYYFVQGLKKREIANLLGESEQSISYWVKKL
ncbi:sigma-70 family RNA polymerase sigma factor [Bacillus megaterium]|nr:sigma-70 family RNA polymerase sigma factor [Priestia megaterium]